MSGVLDLTFMDVKESTGPSSFNLFFFLSFFFLFVTVKLDLIQCITEITTPNEGTESPSKKKKVKRL